MKTTLYFFCFILLIITGCKKTNDAANWVGTYTSQTGSNLNRIIVAQVTATAITMQLQKQDGSDYNTFTNLQKVTLTNGTTAAINENVNIVGYTNVYTFTGSATLNGNSVSFSGKAVNTNNASDVINYSFNGTK